MNKVRFVVQKLFTSSFVDGVLKKPESFAYVADADSGIVHLVCNRYMILNGLSDFIEIPARCDVSPITTAHAISAREFCRIAGVTLNESELEKQPD